MELLYNEATRFILFSLLRISAFFYMGRGLRTQRIPVWKYVAAIAVLLLVLGLRQAMPQDYAFSLLNQAFRAFAYAGLLVWLYGIRKNYALFLGIIFTELMDIWRGVICITLPWLWFTIASTPLGLDERQLGALAIALGCVCVIAMSGRFVRIEPARNINGREMFVSLFPTIICYLNILTIHFRDSEVLTQGNEYVSIMAVLVTLNAIALLIILIATERYFQNQEQRARLVEAEQRIKFQYDLFLHRQCDAEDIRIIYHDMKHHLATLRVLSEDKGRAYLDELANRTEDELSKIDTGDATLNVLIEQKKMHCRRQGIDLQAYVNFRDGAFLSQMEICALFGNAIDNAIEALERAECEDRTIRLTGGTIAGCLIMQCENALTETVQIEHGLPATSKPDALHHGLGLRSISKIAKEHDGTMAISAENGRFVLKWMIPLPNDTPPPALRGE